MRVEIAQPLRVRNKINFKVKFLQVRLCTSSRRIGLKYFKVVPVELTIYFEKLSKRPVPN